MIESIAKKIEGFKKFQDSADQIVLNVVQQNEVVVINLNTLEQLYKGLDSEGNRLIPPYTPYTKRLKRAKGQPTDRVTLLDTGDFYESFEIQIGKGQFVIIAKDVKARKLLRKYGAKVLGLTSDNLQKLIEFIRDDFFKESKKVIFDA